ncbi:MAG: cell division protein ZapA [Sphingobacteriales bacterium]|nr:cell division protein ZapA [Sphingobacteriales bacterium]MBI3718355.1 cell division protein ZapA [Sphingobacteriales bacterium]
MQELIPINIVIGDRTYRVKVSPNDEELVRKTIKIINAKIVEFKTNFAGKDMQDYISMVLIWYATQAAENKNGTDIDDASIIDSLNKLEAQLDKLV